MIRGILPYGKALDEWLGSKRVPEHAGTVPIPFRCFKGFAYFASREFCELRLNGILRRSLPEKWLPGIYVPLAPLL